MHPSRHLNCFHLWGILVTEDSVIACEHINLTCIHHDVVSTVCVFCGILITLLLGIEKKKRLIVNMWTLYSTTTTSALLWLCVLWEFGLSSGNMVTKEQRLIMNTWTSHASTLHFPLPCFVNRLVSHLGMWRQKSRDWWWTHELPMNPLPFHLNILVT